MPALSDDASPFASLMAAEGASYQTPQAEFARRPAPRFLQEQLAEGARHAAAEQAKAEAAKKAKRALEGKDR